MLVLELTRDRKTKSYTLLALQQRADDIDVRCSFKTSKYPYAIKHHLLPPVLMMLNELPFETSLNHFPDFSVSLPNVLLGRAKVFHNISSMSDASVKCHLEVLSGSALDLIHPAEPTCIEQHSSTTENLVDMLLNTTLHVLNINVLQLERLKGSLEQSERAAIEEQHAELVSLACHAAQVSSFDSKIDVGLKQSLAKLRLENFAADRHRKPSSGWT